jgi:hypothetical protein
MMNALVRQVSAQEICRGLDREDVGRVYADLDAGLGLARYSDDRGGGWVASYGGQGADIPSSHPPKLYGGLALVSFVPPAVPEVAKVSPLWAALQDQSRIPQIHRPPVQPSKTEYPDVRISGRTGAHPRDRGGWIGVDR